MPSQLLAIARTAFIEGIRQPVFLLVILLSGLLLFFTTWNTGFAMGYEETGEVSGDNKLLLDVGMATIFVCGMLLAAFVATSVISREIENKTVLTVVSKPVPRPVLIVGKYFGIAGAILMAMIPMIAFLMFALRHGVMSTAADDPDIPALSFSAGAVLLAVAAAAWCNFFYGWSFPQVAVVLLAPLSVVSYLAVLLVSKHWTWQPPGPDFKPQVLVACASLTLAVLVMTAVATAVSTRLSQVMTIVVCFGIFVGSLLSNYLFGRHAFKNSPVATIALVERLGMTSESFTTPGDSLKLTFELPPKTTLKPGDSFYYGPVPNGAAMYVSEFAPFAGDLSKSESLLNAAAPPGIFVTEVSGDRTVTIRNLGGRAQPVIKPPAPGDYAFLEPTRLGPVALTLWAANPNMQCFWLLDAVTQNTRVPPVHLGLIALYALLEIAAFLCLGVVLFQGRDVG
ncbi:MAG: ABC transporter permease subunit [Phycisphaerae bacterium]|nr:ABC transporter permease subunit [Phycisphaerae bacterium]